jgi:hypothetical protein
MLRGFLIGLSVLSGSIQDCSRPNSIGEIVDMGISPLNPVAGDNSTLWVTFDSSQAITGGTATYSYTLNYIPFPKDIIPLCDQTDCPVPIGISNATGYTIFPDVSGRIEIRIEWETEVGTPIWCVKTTYSV